MLEGPKKSNENPAVVQMKIMDQINQNSVETFRLKEACKHCTTTNYLVDLKYDIYIEKLIDDKYLKKTNNGTGDKENFEVTIEAIIFNENGGYLKQEKVKNANYLNTKIINAAVLFGGLMAGLYYLLEISKMFLCR